MKKIVLAALLFITALSQNTASPSLRAAAPPSSLPADSTLSPILTAYYPVKDALVAGDAKEVATAAGEMLKTINGIELKDLTPNDRQAFTAFRDKLAYDSRHISESTDINHQREHFASLSANLFALAKKTRMSQRPIYEDYCPMKKVYWLSSDLAIKNPYFGSSMLTCGKLTTTLKP